MKDIPISPITSKTINRFPALYKIQALKAIQYEVNEAIRIVADSFVMAAMLTLIEEFGFGKKRLKRFRDGYQRNIDFNSDYYGDAVAEGLKSRLHSHGYEYEMR